MELDALSLEYKREYGSARRNLEVSDLVHDPSGHSRVRIFGPGFAEEPPDCFRWKRSVQGDDLPDPLLVTEDPDKTLP